MEELLKGNATGSSIEEVAHYIKHVKKMEGELIRREIGLEIEAGIYEGYVAIRLDRESMAYPDRVYRIDFSANTEFNTLDQIYETFLHQLDKFMSETANIENATVDKLLRIKNEKIQNQRV